MVDLHHQSGHTGVKQTLYFARSVDPQMSKETAKSVGKACKICQSIDLIPVRWIKRNPQREEQLEQISDVYNPSQ